MGLSRAFRSLLCFLKPLSLWPEEVLEGDPKALQRVESSLFLPSPNIECEV